MPQDPPAAPDAAAYAFFGAVSDAALDGELGGLEDEDEGAGALEEELDIEAERSESSQREKEDQDLSCTSPLYGYRVVALALTRALSIFLPAVAAVFAKRAALGGANAPMPVAPPPGATHMPSAALLGSILRSVPVPPAAAAAPPPPPGFYGRAVLAAAATATTPPPALPLAPAAVPSMPWPQAQLPAVMRAPMPARAPPPGFAPMQRAPPTAQAQQPPRAITVAELEARVSGAPSPKHGSVRVLPRPAPAAAGAPLPTQAMLPVSAPLGHERALQPWSGGSSQAVEADALQPGASYASISAAASAPQPRVASTPASAASAQRQRHYESKFLSAEQIEQILRIQWAATHPADVAPYDADYYALAFSAKHGGSGFGSGSSAAFAPRALRELAKAAGGKAATTFVQLEGLGKVPFGNVRRPKPLLELALASERKSSSGSGGVDDDADANAGAELSDAANAVPLETHPRVALRLMLEDGLCLLADVDDCDRLLVSAGGGASSGVDAATLTRRKTLLLEGLTATLRLPSEPAKSTAADAAGAGGGDAVLRAVGSLPKGRRLLAGLLARLPPGGASAARVAWSLARSLRVVFAPARQPGNVGTEALYSGGSADDSSVAALADAAASAVGAFTPLQLCALLSAVLAGGSLPALDASQPGAAAAEFLAAILRTATAKGLAGPADESTSSASSAPEAAVWQATFAPFFATLSARVAAAMAAAATAAASGDSTLAALARRDVPVELLRAAVPHASPAQRAHLRRFLALLGAA